jgi:hypothetical protein
MDDSTQSADWERLYEQISATLSPLGVENAFAKGDYWVLDDNWGQAQQRVEINNLALLDPKIIKDLQALLRQFSGWKIVVAVDVPAQTGIWPAMGLVIYPDKIIDGLQRQYFPTEFRHFQYEGSRPGTALD